MGKYHAGKNGKALCGSGRIDGFKTIVLSAEDWNTTKPEQRCVKCVAAIQARKKATK